MKAKKVLATALCMSISMNALIGCGAQNKSTADASVSENTSAEEGSTVESADQASNTADAVEIHYAYWQDTLEPYLEECKTNFEKANPGIKIVLESTA